MKWLAHPHFHHYRSLKLPAKLVSCVAALFQAASQTTVIRPCLKERYSRKGEVSQRRAQRSKSSPQASYRLRHQLVGMTNPINSLARDSVLSAWSAIPTNSNS